MTKEFPTSEVLPEPKPGLFKELAAPALEHCKQIYSERSDQYGDSWRFDGWLALKASLFTRYGIKPTQYECIATALAALTDVKYSRLIGGYNEDHITDMIGYLAALKSAMREVYKEPAQARDDRYLYSPIGHLRKHKEGSEPIQVRVNGEWKDL